ncbi:hypothetical protein CAEBREN_25654 [Caenorhabditis brenneri]|uniref:Uncharacterized protein n=1 Tax=Caenorhabditis brenneri TaxID=135651 RepID=G0N7H7_CAEBE|nr:hypothetical protein CAEBREN_25654 [Caenorhabditis brenneri]
MNFGLILLYQVIKGVLGTGDLDRVVPGWSTLAQLGPVALGFEHNQVLQTGTLTVENLTADSRMFGPKTYKAYYAGKGVFLQRAGLRLVSVRTAPGSKHPVELVQVYNLEHTRLVIGGRKDAQLGREKEVLRARNARR